MAANVNGIAFAKEICVGNFIFAWCLWVSIVYSMKIMASILFFFVFEAQFFHLFSWNINSSFYQILMAFRNRPIVIQI